MFGKAVYLSAFDKEEFTDSKAAEYYFTSLHIPEEFSEDYVQRAGELLGTLKATGKQVIADISPRGIEILGYRNLKDFAVNSGVSMVRCDFGFSEEEILEAGKEIPLAINASVLDKEKAGYLCENGAKVCAIHNFYPRPETGLDEEFFRQRNEELRTLGIKIAAFLSGDEKKRGPLFEGLPTLEHHRKLPPYVQYLELRDKYQVDLILAGDPAVSRLQEDLITATKKDGILRLPVKLEEAYKDMYSQVWTVREDSPRWTARLKESREYATEGKRVTPANCIERKAGSLTVDNERYLRYSGEIQIVKEDLPADERVNVIGYAEPEYRGLLGLINRGKKIEFIVKR